MPYQYVREPLTAEESDRLSNACETPTERLRRLGSARHQAPRQRPLRPHPEERPLAAAPAPVQGQGRGPHGKKAKVRVVPISSRVRALLEYHFALEKAFPVKTRRAQDIVEAVANRAGITKDVSPHVLRHTFATMALQKGISLPTVQKILGHDSLQTTSIYLNFTDVHIQDEFERKW